MIKLHTKFPQELEDISEYGIKPYVEENVTYFHSSWQEYNQQQLMYDGHEYDNLNIVTGWTITSHRIWVYWYHPRKQYFSCSQISYFDKNDYDSMLDYFTLCKIHLKTFLNF